MQTAKAKVVDNNNREKWPCSHCTAVLCRKSSLRRHEILTHKWDPRTTTTASDEVIEQMKPKKGEQGHRGSSINRGWYWIGAV